MQKIYAGVDIGGTNVKFGLVNEQGEIIVQDTVATEFNTSPKNVLNALGNSIQDQISKLTDSNLAGVGVGLAGQLSVSKGLYIEGPNLKGWKNVPVADILNQQMKAPVIIDNDANVAALGEYMFGAGKGCQHMLMVTLGTGVGGGLVLNGNIFRGAIDTAGEFGHVTIKHDGRKCNCGRKGCVEAYVGTYGILKSVNEKIKEGRPSLLKDIDPDKITPKDVDIAMDKGDKVATEVLTETGQYLGEAIADVVNLLNIERVVVGGGVSKSGDRILGPTRERAKSVSLRVPSEVFEIVLATLGDKSGLVGAAALAITTFGREN